MSDWRDDAACAGHDPEAWFPPDGQRPTENLRVTPNGTRYCKPCHAIDERERRARRKAG